MAFLRRWFLILSALVLGGGQVFAASAREQRAYAAAVNAFQAEMWNRAEIEFTNFIAKYPESTNAPQAALLAAQAQFKQGKFTQTVATLTKNAAAAGPLADQYTYWLGEAQFQNGDYPGAAATFTGLAQQFTNSPLRLRAVVEAASAWARVPDWPRHDALLEDTNGVFQRAAQLDPANELVLDGELSLENSKFQQRDFPGVAAVYGWLTNQWPALQPRLQWEGTCLFCQANVAANNLGTALAAATNLVQIARLTKNDILRAEANALLADVQEQMGQRAAALDTYRDNLTAYTPAERQQQAVLKIAQLAIALGRQADAEGSLQTFLASPPGPATDIALLTLGELHLKEHNAQPDETNHLATATATFDRLLTGFTNSPLGGKAYLDRGWCGWLADDMTNSLADFERAAELLPPSEDLAVARFKAGDALFAQKDFAGALKNYRAVLEDFTNFPAVKVLDERALYQSLRACLELNDLPGASNAVARILTDFPTGDFAPDSALLYGESLASTSQPAAARAVFEQFEKKFPDSPRRPQMDFAVARTYGQEQNWPAAIAGYQDWLRNFPTNDLQPQVDYALALAHFHAGNETAAFDLFSNVVAQSPATGLAPQAQWWMADYYFRTGTNYAEAEKNYKLVFQNYSTNGLAWPAQMMAGRAAMARQDYSGAIKNYFRTMEEDTNCPMDLRVQATFAHGSALMQTESTATNNPLANFSEATNVFAQIVQLNPTNEAAARAWGEIGDCDLQLANYDAATNAYAQAMNSTNVSLRSQAQVGLGITLEKKAAQASGADQTALLQLALDNYLAIVDAANLRDGEQADPYWVKKAGLQQALPLIETLGAGDPEKFIGQLEDRFPQARDSLEKIKAGLPPRKN